MKKTITGKRKKSGEEIKAIKMVQRATRASMKAVILYLQSTKNPTSERAHKIIDSVLATHNCESPLGHIVAGGKQSAEPHEVGNGRLKNGTPIVIDIFPCSKETGYFADMTRTVCIGQPTEEVRKMYGAVLKAQKLAVSMAKPGIKCVDIQNAIEQSFTKAGYITSGKGTVFDFAEGYVHGVGHGVGLDIHESPHLGRGSKDVLKVGDVITIEPGLYYKDIGGIRLEDMILITSTGATNLTNFKKELVI